MISIYLFSSFSGFSQKKTEHSANKAALFSAVLPGSGQAYNKKYWKIPVVYAGFGLMYYYINSNNLEYQKFKNAYTYKSSSTPDPALYNSYVDKYPLTSLQDGKEYYRRNRDLSIILCSFWYLLNITDAAVDAYLFDYDISPDLSLRISPFTSATSGQITSLPGISFTLAFKK